MLFFLCYFKTTGGAGQAAFSLYSCCVLASFQFDHRMLPGHIAFKMDEALKIKSNLKIKALCISASVVWKSRLISHFM